MRNGYDKTMNAELKKNSCQLNFNILVATGNEHKFREIKAIMSDYPYINLAYLDKSNTQSLNIIEDGKTYEENARIKAEGYLNFLNKNPDLKDKLNLDYIVSEDSGLNVECLGGEPGIITARYAGENASDTENINKLLQNMELRKECARNRRADFVCYACLYDIKRKAFSYFNGKLGGFIANEIKGVNGFGYDPVFIIPEFNKTAAEIEPFQKNKISHRAIAFNKAAKSIPL